MTGGSSGGPWIANYGMDAVLSGTSYGSNTVRNVILVSLSHTLAVAVLYDSCSSV